MNEETVTKEEFKLSATELKDVLQGNFSLVLQGLENFNDIAVSSIRDGDKEHREVMMKELQTFMETFMLQNRKLQVTLLEIAQIIEKEDGKSAKIGFTTGLKLDKEDD